MIYVSIAIIIVAILATFILNKHLNQQLIISRENRIHQDEINEDYINDVLEEHNVEINKKLMSTTADMHLIKSELETLRLQISMRNK